MNEFYYWVGAIFSWASALVGILAFSIWALDKIVKYLKFYNDFWDFVHWRAQKKRDEQIEKEQPSD